MAQLDVSEIIADPDFVDPVMIIHRKPVVDGFGENKLFETKVNTIGCFQPTSGKSLARLPDALRTEDVRTIWVRGLIISDGKCQYPDIVVIKGFRYAVQVILDWTNYGSGWTECVAIREVIAA